MRFIIVLGLLVTAVGSVDAQTLKRLPFPDGTYVADPGLCLVKSAQELTDKLSDNAAHMVRHIDGNKFETYETFCEVRNVVQNGSNVKFRLVCEVEGETQVRNGSWIKVDHKTFKIGNRTFTSCGRFIR